MEDEIDVGLQLRELRLSRQISQRELAKRAGVPNATISLIESNKLNPSVGTLKRVLEGIPISMSEFFSLPGGSRRKYLFKSSELVEIGTGAISFRQVGQNLRGRSLQILHERYEPGADTGSVMLSHAGEEGGIIISGKLELSVEHQRQILGPGDGYSFPSYLPHRFRNAGDEPCVLVSACTPPSF